MTCGKNRAARRRSTTSSMSRLPGFDEKWTSTASLVSSIRFGASDSCCARPVMIERWASASIRARLTGWYGAVFALMLLVYATVTFVAVRHALLEQLDERLHEDFEAAEERLTR